MRRMFDINIILKNNNIYPDSPPSPIVLLSFGIPKKYVEAQADRFTILTIPERPDIRELFKSWFRGYFQARSEH